MIKPGYQWTLTICSYAVLIYFDVAGAMSSQQKEDLRPETEGTSTTDLVDGFFSWILMNPKHLWPLSPICCRAATGPSPRQPGRGGCFPRLQAKLKGEKHSGSAGAIWMFPKIGVFPPKWMVKIMENPIKMDDLGGTIIFGNTHLNVQGV